MSFQQRAYQFFISRGYSPAQAAALAGNAQHESSGGRPDAVGDNGKAYGLFQWHPDRQAFLRSFAQREKLDPTKEETQLAFKDWELRNTERAAGDRLRSATDPVAANNAVLSSLRPAGFKANDPTGSMHYDRRLANVNAILGQNYSAYGAGDSPREAIAMGRDVPAPAASASTLKPAEPVYGSDIGTSFRRLGHAIAPDLVDPATPLNPAQIAAQEKLDSTLDSFGDVSKGFLALASLGQPKDQPVEMIADQIRRPQQFKPLAKMRGLLG